ncbi:uncharacterized protein LOC117502534 isoform X2 [Thalassophryne amazonica]|uniref:uncharacterized protein LOC117502534 isoform X2 n=1 Tax=Thalassophryne amazonica TaxID=390379 RepID=UPI001471870E|nr:uncharacterized protein LOC117502534 isoform X2 [Thalassophryne amazonica]
MTGSEVCFCGGKSTRVKTPAVQTVRELVYQRLSIVAEELNQRLAAVAAEIAGLFEEQLCSPPQHGDQQHKLLDTVPKTGDHRADLHHHLVTEEEVFFQQQEWNPVVDQKEPEATQTEEKLGDFWTIHNGEELQQLEEVDVTKFPIILNVKSENDEENPQLLVSKELNSPESGDWSTNVSHEEPEPPQNKQEQEECWTSQEEEQLQQLEEVDAIKFPMKDTCLEDSQLHDSTSVSEDVPDASSKNKGSDAHLQPKQTKYQSRDPLFSDIGPKRTSITDHETCDNKRITAEVTQAEERSSNQETVGSLVVGALNKINGTRVNDKRHYCLYCKRPYVKIARHLQEVHNDELDVAKAMSFPKSSEEKKKCLELIRNKGNHAHNTAVMKTGKGELIPRKRPRKEVLGSKFIHCEYCHGLLRRNVFLKHMKLCKHKPESLPTKPGMTMPSHFSKQFWQVVGVMNHDPITDIVKNDSVIIEVGKHLLNKGGMSAKNQQFVRDKIRGMGRLIHSARRVTNLTKMEDFINPKNFLATVKAVKVTCGYDSATNMFSVPSLAYKLGNALVQVSKFLKAKGLSANNQTLVRNATEFQKVYSNKWNSMVSLTALTKTTKWNVPNLISFTEDMQKIHQFLGQMQLQCSSEISKCSSTKVWVDLAEVCLAQTILFNRRRERRVSSITLSEFLSRDTSDPHPDLDWSLSEVETKLCHHFSRFVTTTKQGRPVPILVTPKILCALELLVKQRKACGILKDNIYLFARPAAMTHLSGTGCIRGFAEACGAKCPKALVSTKLQKHAAALSTVLNMADTNLDQLTNFLSYDVAIHCELDRLPEKTLHLAKISKVLMALEQGRLAEFRDKNLDQIIIYPDEKVLGSDAEELSEEESLPPTVGDEISPTHKRRKPSSPVDEMPSLKTTSKAKGRQPSEGDGIPPKKMKRKLSPVGGGAVRHSKDKVLRKRKFWQQAEVQAVERQMDPFIRSCVVPAKRDCEKCLRAEPEALKNRNWQTLKFYVHNRIQAYKKKVQR